MLQCLQLALAGPVWRRLACTFCASRTVCLESGGNSAFYAYCKYAAFCTLSAVCRSYPDVQLVELYEVLVYTTSTLHGRDSGRTSHVDIGPTVYCIAMDEVRERIDIPVWYTDSS